MRTAAIGAANEKEVQADSGDGFKKGETLLCHVRQKWVKLGYMGDLGDLTMVSQTSIKILISILRS